MESVFIIHKQHFGYYVFESKQSADKFIGTSYDSVLLEALFMDGGGSVIEEHIKENGESIFRKGVYLVCRNGLVSPLVFRTRAAALEFMACNNGEDSLERYYSCRWYPFEFKYRDVMVKRLD